MSNIPILTDDEITAKLLPLKGDSFKKYDGQGICWHGIATVLGIPPKLFNKWANQAKYAKFMWSNTSREKVCEFLYRYERGEISIKREDGQWQMVFHKDPKPRNKLVTSVRITPDGVKLDWVSTNDSQRMEMP
jgi:hypothetical protein